MNKFTVYWSRFFTLLPVSEPEAKADIVLVPGLLITTSGSFHPSTQSYWHMFLSVLPLINNNSSDKQTSTQAKIFCFAVPLY